MKKTLAEENPWRKQQPPEHDISTAWRDLSRLGLPCRYGGRSPDGLFEFLIIDPEKGTARTSGKGRTLSQAMIEAAMAGRRLGLNDGRKNMDRT